MAPQPLPSGITLRAPQPGDMGWVIQQHGELYWQEHGWNAEFEALVAGIVADMMKRHDAGWERGWIAERNGERIGSAFVVRKSDGVAQLRLLILTPGARGLGLGARLTDECIAFARDKGYQRMVLWTYRSLEAARAIYASKGFALLGSESEHRYGQALISEQWELRL